MGSAGGLREVKAPVFEDDIVSLFHGDAMEVLQAIASVSIDAIVTDPPAGIGFMGRTWDHDKGGRRQWTAWMGSVMSECLRVLKPGGHALVWAIPRTSHWTATAIEDAGFEVRDVITHHFGSGFPKSLDVSKAIDKAAGAEREVVGKSARHVSGKPNQRTAGLTGSSTFAETVGMGQYITAPATDAAKQWQGWGTALKPATERWVLAQKPIPKTAQITARLQWLENGISSRAATSASHSEMVAIALSTVWSWSAIWDGVSNGGSMSTTATATSPITDWTTLSYWLSEITPDIIIAAVTENDGRRSLVATVDDLFNGYAALLRATRMLTATEAATLPAASSEKSDNELQQGVSVPQTAPGSEDIVLARKPLAEPNVASQVLVTGTSALNIDGCRVEGAPEMPGSQGAGDHLYGGGRGLRSVASQFLPNAAGRWPANLILSHVEGCRPVGTRRIQNNKPPAEPGRRPRGMGETGERKGDPRPNGPVYGLGTVEAWECAPGCPVAELDRQSGVRTSGFMAAGTQREGIGYHGGLGTTVRNDTHGDTGGASRFFPTFRYEPKASTADRNAGLPPDYLNRHPTVKPVELMRWLCRLVTPPGGVVLDPFMGSGSTLVAAKLEGFRAIGIEQDAESVEVAKRRMGWAVHEPTLFDEVAG